VFVNMLVSGIPKKKFQIEYKNDENPKIVFESVPIFHESANYQNVAIHEIDP
jgi:hypothetical protein